MKKIGIKLADGTFYPVMEEGSPITKEINLTTVKDDQTTIHVDLYRSEDDSMENAEYVDTLHIEHIKKHPNGEPTIDLQLTLDENNELSASIRDQETGTENSTNVVLESTLTNIHVAPESDSDADAVLASTDALGFEDFDLEEALKNPSEPDEFPEDTAFDPNSLQFDSMIEETAPSEIEEDLPEEIEIPVDPETTTDELATINLDYSPDEEKMNGMTDTSDLDSLLDSVDLPENTESDSSDTEIDFSVPDTEADNTEIDFSMPDDEPAIFESTETDSPDFDITDSETEINSDEEIDLTIPEMEESQPAQTETSDLDFSMPDMESDSTEIDFSMPDTETDSTDIDFSMPDDEPAVFDTTESDNTELAFDMPETESDSTDIDFSMPDTEADNSDIDFSMPDDEPMFQDEQTDSFEETETSQDINSFAGGSAGLDFSDLLDEETKEGNAAGAVSKDEIKKKTRVPVIICIICAIICIIGAALVLFVIPSKINLLKSRNTKNTEQTAVEKTEEPAKETPAEKTEDKKDAPAQTEKDSPLVVEAEKPAEQHPAKQEEIVVAPAVEVVPQPVKTTANPADNIKYKIKWGDTLWDISTTYYKTPWKYKKIARFNNIKNPDKIISGTTIIIPAE